jgi:hypothetical protein
MIWRKLGRGKNYWRRSSNGRNIDMRMVNMNSRNRTRRRRRSYDISNHTIWPYV